MFVYGLFSLNSSLLCARSLPISEDYCKDKVLNILNLDTPQEYIELEKPGAELSWEQLLFTLKFITDSEYAAYSITEQRAVYDSIVKNRPTVYRLLETHKNANKSLSLLYQVRYSLLFGIFSIMCAASEQYKTSTFLGIGALFNFLWEISSYTQESSIRGQNPYTLEQTPEERQKVATELIGSCNCGPGCPHEKLRQKLVKYLTTHNYPAKEHSKTLAP